MATQYKRWGFDAPADTSSYTLYAVPENKVLIISKVVVTEYAGSATTFSIGISSVDATFQDTGYLYFDAPITANQTIECCEGLCIQEDMYLVIMDGAGGAITFQVFGALIDQQ